MCDGIYALSELRLVDNVKMPGHGALPLLHNCEVTFPVTHWLVNGIRQYAFHVVAREASIVPRQLLIEVLTQASIPGHT